MKKTVRKLTKKGNNFKHLSRSKQTGAALLEAIVALSAVVVAVAGIAVVITASVSNSQFIQDQNRANKYAQEGIEYIRSYKERSYSEFETNFALLTSRCLDKNFQTDNLDPDCNGSRVGDDGNEKFVRKISVSAADRCKYDLEKEEPAYEVTVSVEWQSSKCDVNVDTFCHSSVVSTCFAPPAFSNISLDFGPTSPPSDPGTIYYGCYFAGSLTQIGTDELESDDCGRGQPVALLSNDDGSGTPIRACLYGNSLSNVRVGGSETSCSRGDGITLKQGSDYWACLYAGSLSQFGTSSPSSCGRETAAIIGFDSP